MSSPAEQWREALAAWAIPAEILAAAPESPWGYPTALFAGRADAAVAHDTPSTVAARAALPAGGSVLDIGCGAGAAVLPLAPQAGTLIGVDSSPELLTAFATRARATGRVVRTLEGRWPNIASQAPVADVVVCHHVVYNVPDLPAFVRALTTHALRRVVLELTYRHPASTLNDLWLRFHGLERPLEPTADTAEAVLRAMGLAPERHDWVTPIIGEALLEPAERVALTRRRLCLPATRDPEIAAALAARDAAGRPLTRDVVTMWWPGAGDKPPPSL